MRCEAGGAGGGNCNGVQKHHGQPEGKARGYVPEIDMMAWGWVEYAEPLTPMEISEYDLISAPREDESVCMC